jgi:hypothetical protein
VCSVSGSGFGAERLDRGVAAFPTRDGGVYIGWRLLADDPADVRFDVYRRETPKGTVRKLNAASIADSTNFVDRTAQPGAANHVYSVTTLGKNGAVSESGAVPVGESADVGGVMRIKHSGVGRKLWRTVDFTGLLA